MRAIGYYRIDDREIGQDSGLLNERFEEYCERFLHQPVAVFGDRSARNRDAHDNRGGNGSGGNGSGGNGGGSGSGRDSHIGSGALPGYGKMIKHIVDSRSNFLIVVPDTTHLGQDLEEVVRRIIELEAMGCKVVCDDDELPDPLQNALDSLGPSGVSKERSERIKDSMRRRAMLGKGLGKPPFGYHNGVDGTLEVVEQEAEVIRLIYDKYIHEGLGLRLIAQHLNQSDIRTRRGGRWNMVTIRDILRNPTYTGTYYRFGLRLPKVHEAIISQKVFRQAQDQTRDRRPSSRSVNTEPFLLSGLVFCGYCNNKMMGVTRRQSWRRKDGKSVRGVYRYYQCQSRNNQSLCGYHTWRAPALEAAALSDLHDQLGAEIGSHGNHPVASKSSEKVQAIWDKRVKNAERRFLLNLKRAARGELGLGAVQDHLRQLDKARTRATTWEGHWDIEETIEKWDALTFEERQAFLLMHISKITVRDDSIEVSV